MWRWGVGGDAGETGDTWGVEGLCGGDREVYRVTDASRASVNVSVCVCVYIFVCMCV